MRNLIRSCQRTFLALLPQDWIQGISALHMMNSKSFNPSGNHSLDFHLDTVSLRYNLLSRVSAMYGSPQESKNSGDTLSGTSCCENFWKIFRSTLVVKGLSEYFLVSWLKLKFRSAVICVLPYWNQIIPKKSPSVLRTVSRYTVLACVFIPKHFWCFMWISLVAV